MLESFLRLWKFRVKKNWINLKVQRLNDPDDFTPAHGR